MAMLFSCKNNLNKEEFEELVKYVLQLKTIAPQYLRGFISKHYDVNKFRIGPKVTEDIYVLLTLNVSNAKFLIFV